MIWVSFGMPALRRYSSFQNCNAAVSSDTRQSAEVVSPLNNVCSRNRTWESFKSQGTVAPTARAVWFWRSQDRNDGLPVFPPHPLDIPNGCDQITSAARSHEQSVLLNEEPGHPDSLRDRNPKHAQRGATEKKKMIVSVNHSPFSLYHRSRVRIESGLN